MQIQPEIAMSSSSEQCRCLSWSSQMEKEPAPETLSAPPTFGCCVSCCAREIFALQTRLSRGWCVRLVADPSVL